MVSRIDSADVKRPHVLIGVLNFWCCVFQMIGIQSSEMGQSLVWDCFPSCSMYSSLCSITYCTGELLAMRFLFLNLFTNFPFDFNFRNSNYIELRGENYPGPGSVTTAPRQNIST